MKREWVSSPLKSAGIGHVHNLGFLRTRAQGLDR